MAKRICIGAMAGAHGVKGEFKVRSFTDDPADVAAYGRLSNEKGDKHFTLRLIRQPKPGLLIARAEEVKTREDAEALKGTKFFIDRDCLPAPDEEEFYYEDLVGLKAQTAEGVSYGKVKAVLNFGAGDLLELFQIPDVKGSRLIPFSKEVVPVLDFENRLIIIDPPEDLLEPPRQEEEERAS